MGKSQASMVLLAMSREVDKVLARLAELGLAVARDGRFELSPKGRDFFGRVATQHQHLLRRFSASTPLAPSGAQPADED
jgi:Mn-dependent DtxR family transcriptional regulator